MNVPAIDNRLLIYINKLQIAEKDIVMLAGSVINTGAVLYFNDSGAGLLNRDIHTHRATPPRGICFPSELFYIQNLSAGDPRQPYCQTSSEEHTSDVQSR